MPLPRKACPIVLRPGPQGTEILAFRHPAAGTQLVKGSIEPGEDPEHAALRELCEESGICDAEIRSFLGTLQVGAPGQEWVFYVCSAGALPEAWSHRCADDGGQDFSFFWHPLGQPEGCDWHPIFAAVLDFIRSRIAT